MIENMSGTSQSNFGNAPLIAFIGFGEAAGAFVIGWRQEGLAPKVRAYDIKTDSDATRAAKLAEYAAAGVEGCDSLKQVLAGATLIFSTVTADQAHAAAQSAARYQLADALYLDCNSCAPGTKRHAAVLIQAAGGRYVDTAVMAPVHPRLHRTPFILAGPDAGAALEHLNSMGMSCTTAQGDIGAASAIKMTRSIMIKGLEALVVECVLAGRKAGVDDIVLESLDVSFPGFGWRDRSAYMLERVMTHGVRRAAEMREVALTVEELNLEGLMSTATAAHQEKIGNLKLNAARIGEGDYAKLADAILAALEQQGRN